MRDYSQYTATPTKTKNRNHAGYNNANSSNSNNSKNVTPSPASSAASFPNFYSYPNSSSSSHQPWKNYNYSNNSSKAKKKDAPSTASTAAVTQSTHQEPQPPQEQEQQPSQEERSRTVQEAYHNNSSSSNASHEAQTHSQSQQQQSQQHSQQLQHSQKPSQQQQVQKQRLSPLKAASPQPSSKSPQPSPRSTKSPQLSPQRFFHSTSPSPTPSPSSNHHHNHNHSLAHADALSLKRDGPEATIASLRKELEEAKARDETDKDHLIKSDATILELRSSVRQLKRQLEKVDGEARQKHQELVAAKEQLQQLKQQQQQQKQQQQNSSTPTTDDTSRSSEHAMAREERVGELQVQLDRAHAQILTADMVRKELEDTLEAEQYTWELRVQDQERTIVELQQEIGVLAEDLELCRHQWKQADEEWAKKVAELEAELAQYQRSGPGHNGNTNTNTNHNSQEVEELHEKMRQLEEERNELQTCLDEALQELEAVDAELGNHTPQELQQLRQENQRLQQVVQKQRDMQQQQQQQQHLQPGDHDIDTLEGLQHLYRWLLERSADGEEKKTDSMPQTSPELLDAIHHVLESMPAWDGNARNTANANANANNNDNLAQTVVELEAQLSVYRGDLQAREESSAELRASLKEAVALIKPLQDAVDKADQQKADLQQEVDRLRSDHDLETSELQEELQNAERKLRMKEQQCERLQQDVERLKSELDDARELAQARQKMYGLSPSAAAAAATAQATTPSQQPPTQELSSLSKARADLKAKREQENTLRNLLRDAQNRFHSLNQQNQSVEAMNQQLQGKLRDAEEQRSRSAGSMEGLEVDVVSVTHQNQQELEEQIAQLRRAVDDKEAELNDLRQQAKQPSEELTQKVHMLEVELNKTQEELKKRQQSEKVLNNSLKEALGLLKPLQSHLEEAEEENKELSQELRKLRRKLNAMEMQGMGSAVSSPSSKSQSNAKSPQGVQTPNGQYARSNEEILREKQELEETVRQLEQENSQLHDALDEMSGMNNNGGNARALTADEHGHLNTPSTNIANKSEARLKEELVELKSRYEVTQSRLEDAYVENHTLVDALKEKEESEKDAFEGMRILREKLRRAEMDLENAKYIATSALVKVEQAKKEKQNISMESAFETESHTVHSLEEKAIELDLLAAAGIQPLPASMSPSRKGRAGGIPHHQQQQAYASGGNHQQQMNSSGSHANSWVGKRSRLADF